MVSVPSRPASAASQKETASSSFSMSKPSYTTGTPSAAAASTIPRYCPPVGSA